MVLVFAVSSLISSAVVLVLAVSSLISAAVNVSSLVTAVGVTLMVTDSAPVHELKNRLIIWITAVAPRTEQVS